MGSACSSSRNVKVSPENAPEDPPNPAADDATGSGGISDPNDGDDGDDGSKAPTAVVASGAPGGVAEGRPEGDPAGGSGDNPGASLQKKGGSPKKGPGLPGARSSTASTGSLEGGPALPPPPPAFGTRLPQIGESVRPARLAQPGPPANPVPREHGSAAGPAEPSPETPSPSRSVKNRPLTPGGPGHDARRRSKPGSIDARARPKPRSRDSWDALPDEPRSSSSAPEPAPAPARPIPVPAEPAPAPATPGGLKSVLKRRPASTEPEPELDDDDEPEEPDQVELAPIDENMPHPWPVDTLVCLVGLKSATFNGVEGVVVNLDETANRYICRIDTGQVTKIKPDNLRLLNDDEISARRDRGAALTSAAPKRTVSYDWVQDNCTIEPERVLKNTRGNAKTKYDGKKPSFVDDVPDAAFRSRKLLWRDEGNGGLNDSLVFIQEFDESTPTKTMMSGEGFEAALASRLSADNAAPRGSGGGSGLSRAKAAPLMSLGKSEPDSAPLAAGAAPPVADRGLAPPRHLSRPVSASSVVSNDYDFGYLNSSSSF